MGNLFNLRQLHVFCLTLGVSACMTLGTVGSRAYAQSGPCHDDVQKFCSGVERGGGRVAKCLHDNKDKLSAACKEHEEKMKESFKHVGQACHDDVQKLCSGVEHGGGRVLRCMKDHKDQLSDTCKKEIETQKQNRKNK